MFDLIDLFDLSKIPDVNDEVNFHNDATYVFGHLASVVVPGFNSALADLNMSLNQISSEIAGVGDGLNAGSLGGVVAASYRRSDGEHRSHITFGSDKRNGDANSDAFVYDEGSNTLKIFIDQDHDADTPSFALDKEDGFYIRGVKAVDNQGRAVVAISSNDAQKLGGILADKFYNGSKSNPKIRMGSDDAGNFDGIVFDERENNFYFISDEDKSEATPEKSEIRAGMVRLYSPGDASETSTQHALEIYNGPNARAKMDCNELVYNHGQGWKAVFFDSIVTSVRLTDRTYVNPSNDNVMKRFGSGCVGTAFQAGSEGNIYAGEYCQMQIRMNGVWVNVGGN